MRSALDAGNLNVVHAASVARVRDRGGPRRGCEQFELDLVHDGAIAIRAGKIAAVGPTADVLRDFGDEDVQVIDATGKTVLPGLVECHSHPLFAGERSDEYAERLDGVPLGEIAARGGGIWRTVCDTRTAPPADLTESAATAYRQILAGGVTTLEVKSGYGLTVETELLHLELLNRTRALTPLDLVVTFLGAHIVPRDTGDADQYTQLVATQMLPAVVRSRLAEFHDLTCEKGLFTPSQASRLLTISAELGIPTRTHADAWAPSEGWKTSVEGGAVSADHLTYTPDDEIREVGQADTIAVLLPMAELIYLTDKRCNARLLIENDVPVAIATDYCSSIHSTSLLVSIALAAPWFGVPPAAAIVGATLNAAYSLNRGHDRGSLDVGKRGDLTILQCAHPNEIALALGSPVVEAVLIDGRQVIGTKAL